MLPLQQQRIHNAERYPASKDERGEREVHSRDPNPRHVPCLALRWRNDPRLKWLGTALVADRREGRRHSPTGQRDDLQGRQCCSASL